MRGLKSQSLQFAGVFDGADYGLGFVEGLLVFEFGDGVGDDAGAGLDVALAADGEQGADSDAGVEVAGEVGVEDCAAVGAAAGGLELFDDFHGADLGSAREGSGGEAGAECVDGGEVGAELALNGADDVHDVGVALDEHEAIDFDATELADAAHVVAAEVNEHDVFGALLLVVHHFVGEALIFFFVCATGAGTGDGTVLDAIFVDADEEFGG